MTRIGRQRGMSLTTGFNVEFDFPSTSKFPADRYKKDKEIIGGFNLKIGDRMIDCTVSNKLKSLRKKLINN